MNAAIIRAGYGGLSRYSSFAPAIGRAMYYARRHRAAIGRVRQAVEVGGRLYRRSSKARAAIRKTLKKRGRKRKAPIDGARTEGKQIRRWIFGTPNEFTLLPRNTLAAQTIRFANAPDSNGALRQAPSMRFFVKGFKMCATFRNISDKPLHMHMAIVQPKREKITLAEVREDFFSDANNLTDRYVNFTDGGPWDRNRDCSNLNNRKFNIMTHQRFQLNEPRQTTATGGPFQDERTRGSSYVHFEKYYPVNKWMEFETTGSAEVLKPVWVFVWYETLFPNDTNDSFLSHNINVISYVNGR